MLSAFLALAVSASALFAQQTDLDGKIKNKESELKRLREQIAEQRKKIEEIEKEKIGVESYLRKLRNEEALTRKLLGGLTEREDMLEQKVEELRNALAANERVYENRLGILTKRLREIYKSGPHEIWQELLDANDFADLLQRYKFLSLIAERDAELVEDVRERRIEIEGQEARITELLHEVVVSRKDKEGELEKLEENKGKRERTLSSLSKREREYRERAAGLEKAQEQLQALIQRLEKERLERARAEGIYGERDFGGLKGRMAWPVEGRTVRGFGRFRHPEFGTITQNTGIDIESVVGSPVRAVARGRVEYADALAGYGNCIIINHGGGYYTLYAHTANIFVGEGEAVEGGAVIAETGDPRGGSISVLHFEIRKSKEALDPAEWLVGR